MPTNNFKLFDENKANMMSDTDYAANQQRLNGVQSGIASSQLQNKTLYQTALMCYALAQIMAANGYDANDANAVSTFVNNLSSSVLQKVVDKASTADIASKNANKWVPASLFGQNMDTIGETYLKLAGGTMTGNLILNSDPTQNLQAATKQYVDKRVEIKELARINFKSSEMVNSDRYYVNSKTLGKIIDFTLSDALLIEIKFNSNLDISPNTVQGSTFIEFTTNMFGIGTSSDDAQLFYLRNNKLDGLFNFSNKTQKIIFPLCVGLDDGRILPFYVDRTIYPNYVNAKNSEQIKANTYFKVTTSFQAATYDFDLSIKTLNIN